MAMRATLPGPWVETAEDMLQTVPPRRLHEVIPAWRQLAAVVRDARNDPIVMERVRQQAAADALFPEAADSLRFPMFDETAPDLLTAHLRSCGLRWQDLITWSEPMQRAIAIADAASV